jgi:hypothetical protein
LISTTTSGGNVGPAAPWELFEAVQAFLEEPLSPLPDHVAPSVETIGDLVVAKALGGEEDDPFARLHRTDRLQANPWRSPSRLLLPTESTEPKRNRPGG